MGGWVVGGAAAAVLVLAFALRTRLPAAVEAILLTASFAALGWGGMLLRPDPPTPEVVLAVAAMALLGPLHVRVVLGPFGRA